MKNEVALTLRVFPVLAHDRRTGQEEAITLPVTKEQLRAAQIVGQSSNELVERLLNRQGYKVLEIGTPDKLTVALDLDELVRKNTQEMEV